MAGYLVELSRRALLPADTIAVCCVGSVAQGWDNPRSDVDFIVVTTTEWAGERTRSTSVPLQPRSVPTLVVVVDGQQWEIKYWLDAQVDQMLAKVSHERFENGRAWRALTDPEELFLERLPTCLPIAGEGWVARRRADLDSSAFRAFVVTRSLAQADAAVEDALGQLSTGDLTSAVLSARLAFGYAVDALLESRGCYGSQSVKWRARRFRDAAPPQMDFDTYWALETMAGFEATDPRRWVERVVAICKDLSLEVEI